MFPRALEHLVVRGGLPLKVIGLHVVAAHRMILELIPHQQAAQIGVPLEDDPEQIEYLALLKLGGTPHRRQRRKLNLVGAIHRLHANHHRPMPLGHRKQVIHRFQAARLDTLLRLFYGLFYLLLHAVNGFGHGARDLHLF